MSDLSQALELETVDTLKRYHLTLIGVRPTPVRKTELTQALIAGLSDPERLKAYYRNLSELEKTFLREAVFHYNGYVQRSRFTTKYGQFPEQPRKENYFSYRSEMADVLKVFFYRENGDRYSSTRRIPATVLLILKQFVERPEPDVIKFHSLAEPLPEQHTLFERERSALNELHAMLISLQNKEIKVSEKTGLASTATLKKLSKNVQEYYQKLSCEEAAGMEFILTYGWLKLIGNSKFSKQSKTTLVPAQKTCSEIADTIKVIWEQWINNRHHDEFRRIDNIKGQTGKGSRYFTNVVNRRQAIIAALKECKAAQNSESRWISFKDLSDYMFISGSELEITSAPEYLYICDPHYGELSGAGWDTLEASYLRCFLVEYAATLGLIDVIMATPKIDQDSEELWGTDDMECLSRYDGLQSLRLTPLGEYVLGLTDSYQASEPVKTETSLTIYREGRIMFNSTPTHWEQQFLSLYAEQGSGKKEKDHVWKLSRRRIMETLQIGGSIDELKQFLLNREDQPFLPENCESLLNQAQSNIDGVKITQEALIITCKSREIADLVTHDKIFSKWCQRLDDLQIVIPKNKEKVFRESLNAMGIGCV